MAQSSVLCASSVGSESTIKRPFNDIQARMTPEIHARLWWLTLTDCKVFAESEGGFSPCRGIAKGQSHPTRSKFINKATLWFRPRPILLQSTVDALYPHVICSRTSSDVVIASDKCLEAECVAGIAFRSGSEICIPISTDM